MKSIAPYRVVLLLLLAAAFLAACPAEAAAWSNGGENGEGFGTHDWILVEAHDLVRTGLGEEYAWVVLDEAVPMTDNPDTVWRDFRNHLYYPAAPDGTINGVRGTADERVAELYGQVVELLRGGDVAGASRIFGALSHYSADIENPTHTASDSDEEAVHQKYEAQVLTRTDLRPRDPEFVAWDGYDPVPDPAAWVRSNATSSYAGYRPLIDAYAAWWAAGNTGMPTAVEGMTEGYLDAASNHLADLMVQAAVDAGIVAAPEGTPEGSLEASSGTPQGEEPAATETWWDRFLGWLASFLGL